MAVKRLKMPLKVCYCVQVDLYLHTGTEQYRWVNMTGFAIHINHKSNIPKYQQLVDAINDGIANKGITTGDVLPSVNTVCKKYKLSRDTVFKAYSVLKENGVIASVPNKGYYVAGETKKVLLVLDTFKAYKEVLYHSFIDSLPENIIADVQFHNYDIDIFKTIINNSLGKYYKYIVMNFDHKAVAKAVGKINREKLLLIDWNIHSTSKNNFAFQDFGRAFYEAIKQAENLFRKYKEIHFLYPDFTNHPKETVTYFEKFCTDFGFKYQIITNPKKIDIKKQIAYISVSDRILGEFLEQCRNKNLEPGTDVGFLSYNETPTKKFIYKGISTISTDFKALGKKIAEFVSKTGPMQVYIPTSLTIRESL